MNMYKDSKRLPPSYLSSGLQSSSIKTIQHQHYQLSAIRGSSSYSRDDGYYGTTTNVNTLAERTNSINRMVDLVDPSSLHLPRYNDTKTLASDQSSDQSLYGTQRRSHRPRGCRGGRKNRKSQQAKAQALIPKEILDDVSSLPHHSISKHSQENVQKWEHPTIGQWNKSAEQPTLFGTLACAGGLPFMSQSYDGAVAFSPSAFGYNNGIAISTTSNEVLERSEMTPSPPPPPPTEMLPPLNSTQLHKATSEYIVPIHVATGATPYAPNVPIDAMLHYSGSHVGVHEPTAFAALTHNSAVSHSMNMVTKLPPKAPLIRPACNPATVSDEYLKLRIQKQRQMMPNGGSLFATSPRSFLLGGPSESSSYMAW